MGSSCEYVEKVVSETDKEWSYILGFGCSDNNSSPKSGLVTIIEALTNTLGRRKQWERDNEIWYMACKKPDLIRFNYNSSQGINCI